MVSTQNTARGVTPSAATDFHTKQAEKLTESGEPPLMDLQRYPEFKPLVDKLVHSVILEINAEARKIESEMPYKAQFTLEEVIRELEERV